MLVLFNAFKEISKSMTFFMTTFLVVKDNFDWREKNQYGQVVMTT
jgi:hypothetical protein